jgi:hypothetical protein
MQALLIFWLSFFMWLFYICACLLVLLFSKVPQNQNTIQSNQQISYQHDTDSLLRSRSLLSLRFQYMGSLIWIKEGRDIGPEI